VPSRGRPQNIIRLIEAYNKTGATTPVWLRLDEDDAGYQDEYPPLWTVETGKRVPLSGIYEEARQNNPDALWYGFLADDVVPITHGWDLSLIDAAGTDGMAVPSGGHGGTPHFVLGGDLVRDVGFLCLPGLDRLYIDTVWHDIAMKRDVLRYTPKVILEHHHFSNGKALFDKTYKKFHKNEDKIIYENWRKTL